MGRVAIAQATAMAMSSPCPDIHARAGDINEGRPVWNIVPRHGPAAREPRRWRENRRTPAAVPKTTPRLRIVRVP